TNEAIKYLREKGLAKASKRKGKVAEHGILGTYIHSNKKIVVVVEVACETDFAAKSESMIQFANDLAIHITAVGPKYISVESIDKDTLATELKAAEEGLDSKPADIRKTIIDGKLEKFYKEVVLLKQQLFTDESKTVEDYLNEMVAKIGEKIEITQFYKFQVGESVVYNVAATDEESAE
ncbi:elongation factor Ts, partial [Candidatus Dojkabacteria bacterium]|nr:elongation factor Ts [Candidatus Dojkabacteria bacterium]